MLIYNPELISKSQLPTSVLQLANPEYKGKLAFAAGETDFQPIVTSVARTYGQAEALMLAGGDQGQRRPATSTPTTRPSPTRSTGARWRSGWSTSTTGTG